MEFSTKRISQNLIDEIKAALQNVQYGSVEIFIQDSKITQVTTRTIKKTSLTIESNQSSVRKTTESKKNGTKIQGTWSKEKIINI